MDSIRKEIQDMVVQSYNEIYLYRSIDRDPKIFLTNARSLFNYLIGSKKKITIEINKFIHATVQDLTNRHVVSEESKQLLRSLVNYPTVDEQFKQIWIMLERIDNEVFGLITNLMATPAPGALDVEFSTVVQKGVEYKVASKSAAESEYGQDLITTLTYIGAMYMKQYKDINILYQGVDLALAKSVTTIQSIQRAGNITVENEPDYRQLINTMTEL
jgi:hypothetical protein